MASWLTKLFRYRLGAEQPSDLNMPDEKAAVTTAEAESFEQHKALRAPKPAEKPPEPAAKLIAEPPEPTKEAKVEVPPKEPPAPPDGGGTGEGSGASEKKAQEVVAAEPAKSTRDKGAERRIAELTAKFRDQERKSQALEKELEALRAGKPAPDSATDAPKPGLAAGSEPEPRKDDPKYETYEQYLDARADWKFNQAQIAAVAKRIKDEEQKTQATVKAAREKRMDAARAKYGDFDEVTAGDLEAGTGLILSTPVWLALLDMEDGLDLAYMIGKSPEDMERLKKYTGNPPAQFLELGRIAAKLSSNGNSKELVSPVVAPPEQPKPVVVSRAPKPPTPVQGTESPGPKSTADASSMEEHRRLRRQQMQGHV